MLQAKTRIERRQKAVWKEFVQLLIKTRLPYLLIAICVLLSLFSVRINTLVPDFQRRIMEGDFSLATLLTLLGLMSSILLFTACNDWLYGYTRNSITRRMIDTIWAKILALPLSVYQEISPKELISRTTTDTAALSAVFVTLISNLLTNSYALYLNVGYVYSYHPVLGHLSLALIPVMILAKALQGRMSFRLAYRQQWKLAQLTAYLSQVLINIPLVKVFCKESYEKKRGEDAILDFNQARFKLEVLDISFTAIDTGLMTLNNILAVVIGGALVARGDIEIGTWIAFYMYMAMINASVVMIVQLWPLLKQAQGAVDRISELMAQDLECYAGEPVESLRGDLCFHNVSFRYAKKEILKNLNFSVREGSFVALVGASGAGKTSLLGLIERFFTPSEGRITLGGQDIQDFKLQDWRARFGYVTQEVNLFSGTLRDALSYGLDPVPSDEEILLVARLAGLEELIARQPHGLDTRIAEGGMTLSGGERQRFVLARVMLSDPDWLLLDEATSNLDNEAQYLLMQEIGAFAKGRTTLCIAHRLATVRAADQIIYLDAGEVSAIGTHDELMAHCPGYRRLVQLELAPTASGEEI